MWGDIFYKKINTLWKWIGKYYLVRKIHDNAKKQKKKKHLVICNIICSNCSIISAKCGNTQGLDKAIKTLNLGEINVYEDLKLDTPGEKHILNALAKANDTKEVKIDLSQLEAKDIKSTGAVIIIEAKKDSKLYSGRIQVTFTSKKVKRVDISTVKKENLGGISNYTGVKEMATILRKEFSLPNLSEKDITITLDSAKQQMIRKEN